MHAVIRTYREATALIEEMIQRRQEIENTIATVDGFVSYNAVRTGGGLVTITICQTEAATQETTARAAAWIRENLASLSIEAPTVTSGEIFLELTGQGV
jgi:hypothetical protein